MEAFDELFEWVWARHHNELSWYVRPLFIVPFCWFAHRRRPWGLVLTVLLLPTSLFWFPAPDQPSPRAEAYLDWERQFFLEGSPVAQVVLAALVVGFFWALATAFWRRSWVWGLVVLNAGTLLKIAWSVTFGGAAGWAAVPPSLVTLVIVNTVVVLVGRRLARRSRPGEASRTDARPEGPDHAHHLRRRPGADADVLEPARGQARGPGAHRAGGVR
jgi:hypothetical protein